MGPWRTIQKSKTKQTKLKFKGENTWKHNMEDLEDNLYLHK